MNCGIIRTALTTTLSLELEYREPAFDKWEYPWYAARDLALCLIPPALVDSDFAKEQLTLMLGDWYQL